MKSFRATYTPPKWNEVGGFIGWDKDKAEQVVVVHIMGYDGERNPGVVFVHDDGKLGIAALPCFSKCLVDNF